MDSNETFSTPDVAPLSEAKRRLLEKYLSGCGGPATRPISAIAPRPSGEPAPLSLSQEQLWLRERGTHGIPPLYNECVTLGMTGPLDVPVLERSLTAIIRRHEIWRTSYHISNGQPIQFVHAPEEIHLPVVDLRTLPSSSRREAEARRIVGEMVRQPFDLKEGPLLRARLIRMEDFEYRLFLCAHLSIVDGVSVYQVFPAELSALYGAYRSGRPSHLPDLAVQFGDYAYWQRRHVQEENLAPQVAYWRKQLAEPLPVLNWPTDCVRPPQETFRGTIRAFAFSRQLSEAVKALSQQEGVTLFMTLLAAFTTLLHCYTQQEDIIIGTPSPAGRKRSEVQKLLGYFLNPVALRFDLTGNLTFRELLRQTHRVTLEAISNDDVPIEILAQKLGLNPDLSRNPFFTVATSLQPAMPQLDPPWSVTTMDIESGGAPWDLYIAFIDRPGGVMARIQYNTDLFESQTVTHMWEHLHCLLESVSVNPEQRLSEAKFLLNRDRLPLSAGTGDSLRNSA